jgi:hypothetical protein
LAYPAFAPIGSSRFGSQQQQPHSNNTRQQRPLSEIWDDNSTKQPSQQPAGNIDLFGTSVIDPKSAAAFWLPPTKNETKETTPLRDEWLETSNNLLSSLAFNDLGSTATTTASSTQFRSGVPISNRPQSATDWTNAAMAWSNAPSNARDPLGTSRWTSSATNSAAGILSPPKTTTATWSSLAPQSADRPTRAQPASSNQSSVINSYLESMRATKDFELPSSFYTSQMNSRSGSFTSPNHAPAAPSTFNRSPVQQGPSFGQSGTHMMSPVVGSRQPASAVPDSPVSTKGWNNTDMFSRVRS